MMTQASFITNCFFKSQVPKKRLCLPSSISRGIRNIGVLLCLQAGEKKPPNFSFSLQKTVPAVLALAPA